MIRSVRYKAGRVVFAWCHIGQLFSGRLWRITLLVRYVSFFFWCPSCRTANVGGCDLQQIIAVLQRGSGSNREKEAVEQRQGQ